MVNRREPVSFIATDNADAARRFYADIIGLELREATDFALVFKDEGHLLRIQIIPRLQPARYTAYGWQVADISREMAVLTTKGVKFERYDQLIQDELGIWTTPDGSKVAWFTDPSGNILSLTEHATRRGGQHPNA